MNNMWRLDVLIIRHVRPAVMSPLTIILVVDKVIRTVGSGNRRKLLRELRITWHRHVRCALCLPSIPGKILQQFERRLQRDKPARIAVRCLQRGQSCLAKNRLQALLDVLTRVHRVNERILPQGGRRRRRLRTKVKRLKRVLPCHGHCRRRSKLRALRVRLEAAGLLLGGVY